MIDLITSGGKRLALLTLLDVTAATAYPASWEKLERFPVNNGCPE